MKSLTLKRTTWILFFACASMFALGLSDNIRGPLFAELLKNFDLSNTRGSLSYATTSLFGLFGNINSSWLMKKFSLDRILISSLALMFVGLTLMGLAPAFNIYLVGAAFFGLSMGYMGVAQNVLVAENFSNKEQAKALSGLHGLYGLSSLLAPLLAATATSVFQNWQSGMVISGGMALLVLFLSFFLKSEVETKIEHQSLSENQSVHSNPSELTFLKLFMVGGVLAFYVVAELLVSTRIALYMRQYHDMDLAQSSLYVTYFFIFLLAGRLIFTFKHFSWPVRSQLQLMLLVSTIFLVLGLWVHPFFLAMTALGMAPFYPMAMVYISEQTGPHKRVFITFAITFQTVLIITMHMAVGWLTDLFGLNKAFYVGLLALGISYLCLHYQSLTLGQKNEVQA